MRILHLSDIHYACPTLNPLQLFSKRFIGNLNYFFNRRSFQSHHMLEELLEQLNSFNPDIILITGDFTTTGDKGEYLKGQALLNQLKSYQVFAIPGNHDIYTRNANRHNPFYHYFETHLPFEGEFGMSLARDRVATFKLNPSIWLTLLDCSKYSSLIHSNGHFTPQIEKKLKALLDQIPQDASIFLCCHYPYYGYEAPHRRLIRHKALEHMIASYPNIHAYLHGHTHRHALADLRANHLPFIMDAGSISQTNRATFNLIDIDKNKIDVSVYLYQSGWNLWRGTKKD